jgi:hypothetical protein
MVRLTPHGGSFEVNGVAPLDRSTEAVDLPRITG